MPKFKEFFKKITKNNGEPIMPAWMLSKLIHILCFQHHVYNEVNVHPISNFIQLPNSLIIIVYCFH